MKDGRTALNDGYQTKDIWFASAMAYTFGPESLTRIDTESNGRTRTTATFHLDIPSLDAAEYYREFQTGKFAISDLRAYCKNHGDITRRLREMARAGETSWCSDAWIRGDRG
jgi:hypothetical protein